MTGMKKLINLWPTIKHKNKIDIKIILHCHYKKIKVNINRHYLKLFRSFNYLKTINYLKQVILRTQYLKESYSKLPVSFCLAIKFVYNFLFKDFTFFTFFTSMDSSLQFLIVRTLKVKPPSVFFLKTGQ